MPLRVPSFPVPGAQSGKRTTDEDANDIGETASATAANIAPEEEEEPAELLDLIDQLEEGRGDASTISRVLRDMGRRIRLSPGDRDSLSDFEGVAQICSVMSEPSIKWKGEAMSALCTVLPDLCRTSTVNRGAFRDGGAVDAVVSLIRAALSNADEAAAKIACIALTAMCTANDGNKKAAASLRGEFNEEELVETDADYRTPLFKTPENAGALDLLLEVLESFPTSVALQTEACAALRTLLSDDDTRQASCVPSAVENRERAVNDEHFAAHRVAVERALHLEASGKALLRLREQAMLLLRELSCRQDRIHEFVFDAHLLPTIEAALRDGDERVVRASLAVIRAFAFSDELKEKLAAESDVALRCVAAVRRHADIPAICEQGFGLFANLTMRKPHIACRLNGPDFRVIAVGQLVLAKHHGCPNVVRSVLQTVRNVAMQNEAAGLEVKESDLVQEMQRLVVDRQDDAHWRSPVEIARQFLREIREDDGLRKQAEYNEFY